MRFEERSDSLRQRLEGLHRAIQVADQEREKSATALATALKTQIESGDHALLLHIDNQKEALEALRLYQQQENTASEKAITKAEVANEKRFEQVASFREQLGQRNREFLPREIFDQALQESRARQETAAQRVEALGNRLTEIEARGSGIFSKTADVKSTMAIIMSSMIGLAAILVAVFGP
jgi:hypothetical protein